MRKAFVLLGVLFSSFALAQQTPKVLLVEGDLWLKSSSGGQLIRLTNYGHNFTPVTSPDGKWVAYLSIPEFTLKYAQKDTFTNVWLMNLKTKKAIRIGGQPNTDFARRGALTWSGDNKAIAWLKFGKNAQSVVLYNLNQTKIYERSFKTNTSFVSLEFSSDGSTENLYGMTLEWSDNKFCVKKTDETRLDFGSGINNFMALFPSGKMTDTGCGGGG
jgi:WD40-like Beta Propeller Repeat